MDNCRSIFLALACFLALSACGGSQSPVVLAQDGQPLPVLYRIDPESLPAMRVRVRDRVNAYRNDAGFAPLRLQPALNAAAAAQARDMARTGQRSHIGVDGASPPDRARAAGYNGVVLGESLAETFAADLATLDAWMAQTDTRAVLLDERGRDLGFAYFQDENSKIWWVLVIGADDDGGVRPG